MCKNKDELNKLVAKYRKLAALEKKVKTARDAIKDDIIDYATRKGEKGGKDGTTGKKLEALLGDKISEYQKTSTYPKLDIR